jgi:hypothetical protein
MANPSTFGLQPTGPEAAVTMGRHAMNLKPSPYSSASTHPFGAPRFSGSPFWVDVDAAKAAGATFHNADDIIAALDPTVPASLTATRLGAGASPSVRSRPDLARREALMR